MNRIAVICIAIAGAMVGTSACVAETYPTKPVRMIVPSIAGGNADIQARYIAERLSEALGKQFVVDAQERYANVGAEIRYNSPEEFQALIRAEMAKWAKVIKAAGIRVD